MEMSMNTKTIVAWALQRARERSTWAGLAALAVAFGAPALGAQINQAGQIALIMLGAGLSTSTTSSQPNPVA
jgi:hypothetical protein